jgi:AraC-like DNA-binding protein
VRDHLAMLRTWVLADVDGIVVRDVRCRHLPGPPSAPAVCDSFAVVLVRRGCFTRRVHGRREVLCPSTAYLQRAGHEESFDHPIAGGDDCTVLSFRDETFTDLFGERPERQEWELPLPAALAVLHRGILAAEEGQVRAELALDLAARVAEIARRRSHDLQRRDLTPAQRRLVIAARESLAADPTQSLTRLAAQLSVSTHHLSRTFSQATGRGVARHRLELRICAVLQRLQEGEDNLARLAADLGFADHAHLTRTLRLHTGRSPSQLRHQLHPATTP